MSRRRRIARQLAAQLLAGVWTRRRLFFRAKTYLGSKASVSLRRLIDDAMRATASAYPPDPNRLAKALVTSGAFPSAARRALRSTAPIKVVLGAPAFVPAPALAELSVPKICATGDLAAWLEVSVEELEWFADTRQGQSRSTTEALRHYRYVFTPKRDGALRLLEAPKLRLKDIQRRILRDILDHVPVHRSVHGFVRGRSCISGAQIHSGEFMVVRLDLRRFFPSIPAGRVRGIFRSIGYPSEVAHLLSRLCTTAPPREVLDAIPDWAERQAYAVPHLAQGAPTSPSLANLCAWRLDQRLSGLALRRKANYSRYADDLCFSGDRAFAQHLKGMLPLAAAIVRDEGFALNVDKTRLMRSSTAQVVTGVVVNEGVNVSGRAFDRLKAILENCRRSANPEDQNRDHHGNFRAHLEGRIAWVEQLNPRRGGKLRSMFDQIRWVG